MHERANAFGSTRARKCVGATCPGGFEARSLPGYYTLSATKGIVEPCDPPAVERCVGWGLADLKTMCGQQYTGHYHFGRYVVVSLKRKTGHVNI